MSGVGPTAAQQDWTVHLRRMLSAGRSTQITTHLYESHGTTITHRRHWTNLLLTD